MTSENEAQIAKTTGYSTGDLVSHPIFGNGKVMAVEADKPTIEFEDGRVKKIVDYYVKRRKQ